MKYKIVADSCCDMTPKLSERLGVITVPLTMRLGEDEYVDDDNLDLPHFMKMMKQCQEKVGSAAPSPMQYQHAIEKAENAYVITLSSRLSASYESAVSGKNLAVENGAKAHIFDSKSATAGEVLIALKIKEMIEENISHSKLVERISKFIDNMKTYFVLENYDNLMKNGRMTKVTGILAQIMNIKLVMGADGDGNIALYKKARGKKKMLNELLALIDGSGKRTDDETMVITHCNNLSLANELCELVKRKFNFKEILVVPTRGLSSLYADDQGIVMAF